VQLARLHGGYEGPVLDQDLEQRVERVNALRAMMGAQHVRLERVS
jgi:hypothetical protein